MPKFSIDTSSKRESNPPYQTPANEKLTGTVYTKNDIIEPPLITYYARVLDNLSGLYITDYKNAMDNEITWYYGQVYKNTGESQYIVQFDIWNNEPAFNQRFYDKHCRDARNIKFGINFYSKKDYPNDEEYDIANHLQDINFMYARIYNEDYNSEWQLINNKKKIELISNTTNDKGVLYGNSDHCIIQTKIILDEPMDLDPTRYYFYATIDYTFD